MNSFNFRVFVCRRSLFAQAIKSFSSWMDFWNFLRWKSTAALSCLVGWLLSIIPIFGGQVMEATNTTVPFKYIISIGAISTSDLLVLTGVSFLFNADNPQVYECVGNALDSAKGQLLLPNKSQSLVELRPAFNRSELFESDAADFNQSWFFLSNNTTYYATFDYYGKFGEFLSSWLSISTSSTGELFHITSLPDYSRSLLLSSLESVTVYALNHSQPIIIKYSLEIDWHTGPRPVWKALQKRSPPYWICFDHSKELSIESIFLSERTCNQDSGRPVDWRVISGFVSTDTIYLFGEDQVWMFDKSLMDDDDGVHQTMVRHNFTNPPNGLKRGTLVVRNFYDFFFNQHLVVPTTTPTTRRPTTRADGSTITKRGGQDDDRTLTGSKKQDSSSSTVISPEADNKYFIIGLIAALVAVTVLCALALIVYCCGCCGTICHRKKDKTTIVVFVDGQKNVSVVSGSAVKKALKSNKDSPGTPAAQSSVNGQGAEIPPEEAINQNSERPSQHMDPVLSHPTKKLLSTNSENEYPSIKTNLDSSDKQKREQKSAEDVPKMVAPKSKAAKAMKSAKKKVRDRKKSGKKKKSAQPKTTSTKASRKGKSSKKKKKKQSKKAVTSGKNSKRVMAPTTRSKDSRSKKAGGHKPHSRKSKKR